MLLSEAAKRNPDAAQVLQNSGTDHEALQRALQTATTLSTSQHHQQQQHLHEQKQQQQSRDGSSFQRNPRQSQQQNRQHDPDKVLMELHVGGLPDQIRDEQEFTRFLNEIAIQKRINIEPGNPIISTRINHVGHFAFAMFRNKEEAQRGLELNGAICFGNALRVDRPRGYKEKMGITGGGGSHSSNAAATQADENQLISTVLATVPIPSIPGFTKEELRNRLEASIGRYGDPTSLVQLSNLGNATYEDVDKEVRKYGNVVGVKPAPDQPGAYLVKMGSIQEAEKLVQIKRAFQKQVVQAFFRPLVEWTSLQ
jgi:hypothetical protein